MVCIMKFHFFIFFLLISSYAKASDSTGIIHIADKIFKPINEDNTKLEWMPLANYDSDLGFGFGTKGFYLNPFDHDESFDLILFASTGGERLIRFTFSYPDIETRQGTEYPLAVDFLIDINPLTITYAYSTNMLQSKDYDAKYRDIPILLSLVFSRGFSEEFVGSAALRYNYLSYDKFNPRHDAVALYDDDVYSAPSIFLNLFLDKRDSHIRPTEGYKLSAETELYLTDFDPSERFTRIMTEAAYYKKFLNYFIFATRIQYNTYLESSPPFQLQHKLGGNKTLRGYPRYYFRGRSTLLSNTEIRVTLPYNLGLIMGADAGKAWDTTPDNLKDAASNFISGLRYFFKTFVVGFDLGFSENHIGAYFSFGHLF